jgi:hypothetical protein
MNGREPLFTAKAVFIAYAKNKATSNRTITTPQDLVLPTI